MKIKDTLVQWGFYLLYALCTAGLFFGILFPAPELIPISLITAVIGVAGEADYFRVRWPIKGTSDYDNMVHQFRDAIVEGKERATRGEKL